MFSFGDERVIGPSDWQNMGRTFDTLRVDLQHPGVNVSSFAASVVYAIDGQIDHHTEGNNIYGIYSSFTRLLRSATIEPYLLWRLAPRLASLPETEGRGYLSEVTGGSRLAGTLPGNFDYDVEMNKQTGSLGPIPPTPGPDTGTPAIPFRQRASVRDCLPGTTTPPETRIQTATLGSA